LPGSVPRALDTALAHRHLELLLDGLRGDTAGRSAEGLSGPAMSLADLQAVAPEPAAADASTAGERKSRPAR
jgi:hypothetical protein